MSPNPQLPAEALLPALLAQYDLPEPVACAFLRRGFNDHYAVTAGTERFILRLYFNGKYYVSGAGDFHFELELLRFLKEEGVPVSYPLPRRDGELLARFPSDREGRYGALFTFADGEGRAPIDQERARRL